MASVNIGLRQRGARLFSMRSQRRRKILARSRTRRAMMKRKPFSLSRLRLLEDDSLIAPALARIDVGDGANQAWSAAIDPEIASYDAAEDPYFPRARIGFSRSAGSRAADIWPVETDQIVPPGVILAADDMPPSTFLATDCRMAGCIAPGKPE